MYYNAALVLEGGAMRGLYTSGVLDTFLEHDINLIVLLEFLQGL